MSFRKRSTLTFSIQFYFISLLSWFYDPVGQRDSLEELQGGKMHGWVLRSPGPLGEYYHWAWCLMFQPGFSVVHCYLWISVYRHAVILQHAWAPPRPGTRLGAGDPWSSPAVHAGPAPVELMGWGDLPGGSLTPAVHCLCPTARSWPLAERQFTVGVWVYFWALCLSWASTTLSWLLQLSGKFWILDVWVFQLFFWRNVLIILNSSNNYMNF